MDRNSWWLGRGRGAIPTLLGSLFAGVLAAAAAPQTTTVVLQDGVDGYVGASDNGPNGVFKLGDDRKSTDVRWPNPDYRRSIRFDQLKAALPGANVHVLSAELSLRYFDEWWSVNVYHIAAQRSLDGTLDNLNTEADDTVLLYGDRFKEGEKTPRPAWITWKPHPETVQSWLDDPIGNHGLVLRVALRDHSRGDEGNYGVSFRSCSYGVPAERPRLAITYSYTGSLPPRAPEWDFNYRGAVIGTSHLLRWRQPVETAGIVHDVECRPPGGKWTAVVSGAAGTESPWQTAALQPGSGYQLRLRARIPHGPTSDWIETPPFRLVREDVAYQVGICTSMEKIRRDMPFEGQFLPAAKLDLGRDETGSVQLVVANVNRSIHALSARVSDLKSPVGTLASHAALCGSPGRV